MFDQHALEYFVAIVDLGSVSAAAEICHVSQPAVSRQLKRLEQQVGSQLFHRTSSGMILTGIGARLEPLARDLLTRHRRAQDVVASLGDGTPRFIAACPETTANFFVAPFVAAGGGIRDVMPLSPAEVYSVLGTHADLAINTARPPERFTGFVSAEVPVSVQFHPEDAPPGEGPLQLRELVNHPFFMPGEGSAVERHILEAAAWAALNVAWGGSTSNATFAQARAAAKHGWAACIEPLRFGLDSRVLMSDDDPVTVRLHVAWDPEHYAAAEVSAVARELAAFISASDLTAPADHF